MALLEEAVREPRNGRFINSNLPTIGCPFHADIPHLEAFFVDEVDHHASAIGVKGLAELSLVGVAAAVANAVYHATGRRIRDLPIVPNKLLMSSSKFSTTGLTHDVHEVVAGAPHRPHVPDLSRFNGQFVMVPSLDVTPRHSPPTRGVILPNRPIPSVGRFEERRSASSAPVPR